jgi:hypothetical protein
MRNRFHIYYQLVLADFRERTRRSGFFVTMLGILFLGYLVITGKYSIQFGEFRPIYDSAWIGSLMAVCSSIILTIFGFYLVKGSIKRDRRTEVGQIIAATPMSNSSYIIAKFASNIIVLWSMIGVLAIVAFFTLLFRNEAGNIDLVAFALPFVIIALPAMVFVASMAVLFDTVKWLRGSVGNIVYLFLAEMCLVMGMLKIQLLDVGSISLFTESIRAAALIAFPGEKIPLIAGFVMFDKQMQVEVFKTFSWQGIEWSSASLLIRLFWIGAALAAVGVAVPFFDRFDPARGRKRRKARKAKSAPVVAESDVYHDRPELAYSKIQIPQFNFSLVRMAMAELRLAYKGYHWFWYLVAIGLSVSQLAAPFDIARQYLTPVSMIWPLIIWSSMGTRESQHDTGLLLFSSPEPVRRQLPAIWLSGLMVAMAAISCMVVRSVIMAHWFYAAALLMGAFFVPSASLALGTLSKSKRLFEVIYLMIWYVGSIEHLSAIDLLGTSDEAITISKFIALGLLSISFLITAIIARRMQIVRS